MKVFSKEFCGIELADDSGINKLADRAYAKQTNSVPIYFTL